jgi:predicted nucleotidyltransferase
VKLEETLRVLYDGEVEFVLIGGAAMRLQGSARLTEDLDFCYSRSKKNIERLARALKPYQPRLRNAPEDLPFRFDAETIHRGLNFTLLTDLGALDFLGEVSGLGGYEAVKAAAEKIPIYGLNHLVLSISGLIKAKEAAGREKDMDAIKELRGLMDLRKKTGL